MIINGSQISNCQWVLLYQLSNYIGEGKYDTKWSIVVKMSLNQNNTTLRDTDARHMCVCVCVCVYGGGDARLQVQGQ